MPPELLHDEAYASEEDSDFAPEDALAEESSESDEEEATDAERSGPGKRKRPSGEDGADDDGFQNSGDEAIIEKGRKRQQKSRRKDSASDGDEPGEGGLIKTRRMRAAEKAEKQTAAASGPVTIDVDELWARMTSEPVCRRPQDESASAQPHKEPPRPPSQAQPESASATGDADLIRIKRTYNFAGKVHTEEKLVSRDSAEAKLYLAENGADGASPGDDSSSQPSKRMPRKAFRSAFEPVPADGVAQRSDLNLGMSARLRARELAREADAKKLNTVEKSRMDWAAFVDREGIKDELELAGKSKNSFAARQDFLARSEAIREEEARRLRMAGRA